MPLYYRLFHVTTEAAAAAILVGGFRDRSGSGMSAADAAGVWVLDRPPDARAGTTAAVRLLVEVEADPEEMHECEWVEDGKPCREWLLPAAVLNTRATVGRATAADERAAADASYPAADPAADD